MRPLRLLAAAVAAVLAIVGAVRRRRARVARRDARRRRSLRRRRRTGSHSAAHRQPRCRTASRGGSSPSTTTAHSGRRCSRSVGRRAEPTCCSDGARARPRRRSSSEVITDGSRKQASQASNLLGVLTFADATSGRRAATPVERTVAAFREAVRLDLDNDMADTNLELLLRLLEARGERIGPTRARARAAVAGTEPAPARRAGGTDARRRSRFLRRRSARCSPSRRCCRWQRSPPESGESTERARSCEVRRRRARRAPDEGGSRTHSLSCSPLPQRNLHFGRSRVRRHGATWRRRRTRRVEIDVCSVRTRSAVAPGTCPRCGGAPARGDPGGAVGHRDHDRSRASELLPVCGHGRVQLHDLSTRSASNDLPRSQLRSWRRRSRHSGRRRTRGSSPPASDTGSSSSSRTASRGRSIRPPSHAPSRARPERSSRSCTCGVRASASTAPTGDPGCLPAGRGERRRARRTRERCRRPRVRRGRSRRGVRGAPRCCRPRGRPRRQVGRRRRRRSLRTSPPRRSSRSCICCSRGVAHP